MQDLKYQYHLFRINQRLILYLNAFLFSHNQILSLKRNWAHTIRVIHPVVVEVATRIHIEHVSTIRAVIVIRRQTRSPVNRLTSS